MKWSERYIGEWRESKDEVFQALALMINQYLFVRVGLTQEQYRLLRSGIQSDWRMTLRHISADRIIGGPTSWGSDEIEEMLVSVHCLAIISWDMLYNKFYPEKEEDIIHDCMGAGERAVDELVRYGLLTELGVGGKWTPAGIDMLNGKLR